MLIAVLYEIIGKNIDQLIEKEIKNTLGEYNLNQELKSKIKSLNLKFNSNNDFLGYIYMSLLSIGEKDTRGTFYTPNKIVTIMVDNLLIEPDKKILDPGCGSGNFLMALFKKLKTQKMTNEEIIRNLYGYDIDPIAVLLSKINLYLLAEFIDYQSINVYQKNFLTQKNNVSFDIIIGNPPWGIKYSKKEKKELELRHNFLFSKEDSFSQFIYVALNNLIKNGKIFFVLPSSILNIKKHLNVRSKILENKIISIDQIGRGFEEIVTDVVLLQIEKSAAPNHKITFNGKKYYQKNLENNIDKNFILVDNVSNIILNKIKNSSHFLLTDKNSEFALGIVTGDNKKMLLKSKTKTSMKVLDGKKITKYKLNDFDDLHLEYERDKFQQVAKDYYYFAPKKIVYKFIGKKLMFAVDYKQNLTLNSANIILIKDKELEIEIINAVLNSRVIQLWFDKNYNTFKVLKNHIQSFPIFNFSEKEQKDILKYISEAYPTTEYNQKIEKIIYNFLNLTEEEINHLISIYK